MVEANVADALANIHYRYTATTAVTDYWYLKLKKTPWRGIEPRSPV